MRLIYLNTLIFFGLIIFSSCANNENYQTYIYPIHPQKLEAVNVKVSPELKDKISVKDIRLSSDNKNTYINIVIKNKTDKVLNILRKVIVFTKNGKKIDLPYLDASYFTLDPYEEKYLDIIIPKPEYQLSEITIYLQPFSRIN